MDPALLQKYPSLKKFQELGDDYWKDGRETKLLDWIYARPDLEQLRNNPAAICAAMDDFAAQHDFLINIGPDKARPVVDMINTNKPRTFVEMGGYVGYSAIAFGHALRSTGVEGVRLWSLEFSPLFAAITMNLVDLAGLSDVVKVVTGAAADSVRRLVREGRLERIDMLFLDHVEDLYHEDLQVCEQLGLLKSGACIVADNVLRPGAPKYREYVNASSTLETKVTKGLIVPGDFEDEVWFSQVK
ncbi:hypothetical protein HMN09_00676300 [Mycena chlorophos]|uniref:catechol O-methyltransferase n=1 Tax=Mycena chlorophos TaxID=658473 RepID=A0A8H6WB45_MYCCL|nr:hypothetical protein HMN09_00676300 [Mycena chlorophos]